jgi:hypothetical protein
MGYYLPTDYGSRDLILDALTDLLTAKCKTEVDTGDVSRAVTVKAGPNEATPESVMILIHENDPMDPQSWVNQPLRYRGITPRGSSLVDQSVSSEDRSNLRASGGLELIGGGSQYKAAYQLEIEIFGRFVPGLNPTREEVRGIAAAVTARAREALLEAGHTIGTGALVQDDFGGSVIQGPFIDKSWTDQEEGEALRIRRIINFWYHIALDWDNGS